MLKRGIFADCVETQKVMFFVDTLYISYEILFRDFVGTASLIFMKVASKNAPSFRKRHTLNYFKNESLLPLKKE